MEQSVIIIGGGIIGAATALQLARAGQRVLVVNAGGAAATDAAFGWINASFFIDDDHHRLRAAGIAAWQRLTADLPVKVDWQGCLCWDMEAAELDATYAQLRGFDYPVQMLTQPQIAALEPALKLCPQQALLFPNEGAAASHQVAEQFLSAAQGFGAKLISNVRVTGIKMRGDVAIGVETSQGAILADQVLIAAGTGSAALAASIGKQIPLKSRPAYIMRTAPQAPMLRHILATPEGEIRQEPNGQLLMPVSVGHQGDTSEALSQSPIEAAEDAMTRLRGLLDGLEDTGWTEVLRAERPVPQDDLPILGPIANGVYAAVSHSGITLAPVIAELVAKDMGGRLDNHDAAMIAPYRPQRFVGN
ncbi:MAG: NAD(P)/FAD-dependent oxidoreductase [Yoonia sp.]|uniref:NAD(P)/FAD-dependent oxidoreductase n=1 Tax=Yoonia sp. TaxID=2212373 RepID=UPI003EF74860